MRPAFSVGQRFALALGLMVILVLVSGAFGFFFAASTSTAISTLDNNLVLVDQVTAVERTWAEAARLVDGMLLQREVTAVQQQQLEEHLRAFDRHLSALSSDLSMQDPLFSRENAALVNRLNGIAGDLEETTLDIAALGEQGAWARAERLRFQRLRPLQTAFDQNLFQLADNAGDNVQATVGQAERFQSSVVRWWQVLTLVALVIIVLLGIYINRGIIQPLRRLTVVAEGMAAGHFEERVHMDSGDEVGILARAFNTLAEEIQSQYARLEQRVIARTRALRTSIEVGRSLSTIVNREELIAEVVRQVQESFGYYHVHIYLLDSAGRELEMVGGTGAAGQQMLARGHALHMGQGLVGRTAREQEPVLVPDVSEEPAWLPNPLLPETRAEVAVPITYGGTLLGVLDVQHDVVEGLDQGDVELLQSIAGQVGIALQNARLVEESERRAEMATMVNAIGQRIQRATTVEEVLRVATRELSHALAVDEARVQLSREAARRNGGEARPEVDVKLPEIGQ